MTPRWRPCQQSTAREAVVRLSPALGHGAAKWQHVDVRSHVRLLAVLVAHDAVEDRALVKVGEARLGVPLEEVEAWVVRTITSGLIDAKMDQLKSRVVITRCTHRVFYHAQWAQLQEKLATWKGNLRSILSTLKKTKGLASRQLAS